jgi:formylglycine-generating enzyme required for sulfatase activity
MDDYDASQPTIGSSFKAELLSADASLGAYRVLKCFQVSVMGALYSVEKVTSLEPYFVWVLPLLVNKSTLVEDQLPILTRKLSGLESPSLLRFLKYEKIDERMCFFYEWFESQTLEAWSCEQTRSAIAIEPKNDLPEDLRLQTNHPFSLTRNIDQAHSAQIKRFVEQLSAILMHAHQIGLYHQALIPRHCLINPMGEIRLVGLGLMSLFDQNTYEQVISALIPPIRKTRDREILEVSDVQLRGHGSVLNPVPTTDVHGLGVFTLYLITGKKPTLLRPWELPVEFLKTNGQAWHVFLLRCLTDEMRRRYASMSRLREDLEKWDSLQMADAEEYLESEPFMGNVPEVASVPSMRKRIAFLSISVIVFALILFGLVRFLTSENEVSSEMERIERVVELGDSWQLELLTDPQSVQVSFKGTAVGRCNVLDGRLRIRGSKGPYEVFVSAEGFLLKKLELKLTSDPVSIPVQLEPEWGLGVIKSAPHTLVELKTDKGLYVQLGTTDASGLLELNEKVLSGDRLLRFSHPAYEPLERLLTVTSKERSMIEIPLSALPVAFSVRSDPSGAEVFLNGYSQGFTPLDLSQVQAAVPIQLRLFKQGYHEIIQEVVLKEGRSNTFDAGVLTLRTGALTCDIQLSGVDPDRHTIEQMKLIMNGTVQPYTTVLDQIREGVYTVEVAHPDYYSAVAELTVQDAETVTMRADLKPRPGRLSLTLEPKSVVYELWVNGSKVEGDNNVYAFEANGVYDVELRSQDFLTASRQLRFLPNQEIEWNLKWIPIPGPQFAKVWQVPYLGMWLNPVSSGIFKIGSLPQEHGRIPNEGPLTEINLEYPFWMGRYEVTQREYESVMGFNPSLTKSPQHPVDKVSWTESAEFCRRLTDKERTAGRLPEGYVYRLPTQAEWEYVCRAGSVSAFHFGDRVNGVEANCRGLYPRAQDSGTINMDTRYGSLPVGSFEPNAWGFFDMHGNVGEWCQDSFNDRYPGISLSNWSGEVSGEDRAVRGGGWSDLANRCRSAARERLKPIHRSNAIGFRVVLAPAWPIELK